MRSFSIVIFVVVVRGTALSHHGSVSSAFSMKPSVTDDLRNEEESLPSPQAIEQHHEVRRPRVSFSEFKKIQFFDEPDDSTYQSPLSTNRRHRHRSAKKLASVILNTQVSPPSIQQSQSLYTPYRPLSRQQPVEHELNIRKQQLMPSPRAHTSRITHLPDILNQTLPNDTSSAHERLVIQREKTFYQFPESAAAENPINSSTEISRESTRAGGIRPIVNLADSVEPNDFTANSFLNSSSISSSTASRQRSNLRSISLRQQFMSPIRSKQINTQTTTTTTTTSSRRSASLKNAIVRNHSVDENPHDPSNQNFENRPMTGLSPTKHSKRNYIIHFNSKSPFNGNTAFDAYDSARHISTKTSFHETSPERFQNLLKVVRPPYITNLHSSHQDPSLPSTTTVTAKSHFNGSIRSSHTTSEHTAHDYHVATNTIFV